RHEDDELRTVVERGRGARARTRGAAPVESFLVALRLERRALYPARLRAARAGKHRLERGARENRALPGRYTACGQAAPRAQGRDTIGDRLRVRGQRRDAGGSQRFASSVP